MSKKVVESSGIGGTLLLITFVVLAVLKVQGTLATVSWWLITLPLWFGPAVVISFFAILGL